MTREPFPLQWPEGWTRTSNRRGFGTRPGYAKFETSFARDRDSVVRQLRRRGTHVVITSNLPTRGDGLPYADGTARDPGIAVYWVERGHERVIACDRWTTCALNLRAIELSLDALRGLDRWGATDMVERAFAGFAALPPGSGDTFVPPAPASRKRSWREVLGETFAPWPALDHDELLDLAKSRHRKLMKLLHPDVGGTHEQATELNVAIGEAEQELGA